MLWLNLFTLISLNFISFTRAGLYVTQPNVGSTCYGGQPCTVQWLDDGEQPLLTSIGVCTVGLYTGEQQIVQQIPAVDVATNHSLTFTPDSSAGPDAGSYYVAFTSTTAKTLNGSDPYQAFSAFFSLADMDGSFNNPIASDTSTLPIPSSVSQSIGTSPTATTTVGTIDTSYTFPSVAPSVSSQVSPGFSTSTSTSAVSGSTTAPASSSPSSPTKSASSARRARPAEYLFLLALGLAAPFII